MKKSSGLAVLESGIAVSALTLGAMVAFHGRPPMWLAAVVVAIFGIFHGHAHGTELPAATSLVAYSSGFVLATGLLHVVGILIAATSDRNAGAKIVRVSWGDDL